jgi:hypothetical protein
MTDKFKVGDLVVYIPTTGQILESQISRILKIENGYIILNFYGHTHKILPNSIHHYPLQKTKETKFEIEI